MILAAIVVTVLTAPPRAALPYRRALVANARLAWGLDAPVAVLAAQVHQESGWNPRAKSAYAGGLAQFTPATAAWAGQRWADLAPVDVWEPGWALRALARYDRFLFDRARGWATGCDTWAATLSAYNGGERFLQRERADCRPPGCDPARWWLHVETRRLRSVPAFEENRHYPRRILLLLQPGYLSWGRGVTCEVHR